MSDREPTPEYVETQGSFDESGERNIPVGVTIIDNEDGTFELYADNYMPFKSRVEQWA